MAKEYVPVFFDWLQVTEELNDQEKGRLIDAVVYWATNDQDPDCVLDEFSKKQFEVYEQIKQDYILFTSFPNGRAAGKFHWHWEGGKTPINQRERSSKEYFEWRKAVFERDKFTCQVCGQVGGGLQAHHIKPWSTNVNERYQVSNGVTLCEKCHKGLHKKGG